MEDLRLSNPSILKLHCIVGWAEGIRLRYNEKGWFPINHTDEIDSRHMRARNLMQRYRLITASQNIVNKILGK